MRNETTRTLIYLAVAAVAGLLGYTTYQSNQPRELAEFERVGEEFYPEFNNPNEADSLEVYVFNEDKASISDFSVQKQEGLWRIPSHYDYPADAKEQLAKTAASIIGIKRTALASRLVSDHERLGVIDPTLQDSSKLKGRGSRITLKQGDQVLADYIIGKKFPEGENRYHVRVPSEKETYIAEFSVDLSTKFSDWIDTDLLKIEQDKLTDIIINKYTLDEQAGRLKDVDVTEISRKKFGEEWKIAELDLEQEEVNHDAVKKLVSSLVGVKIMGVRPKPTGLTPDLKLTEAASRNPILQAQIQADLSDRGFLLAQRESGGFSVIAKEGSFYAGTNEGVVYELHFGEVFTGNLKELEVGGQKSTADQEQPKEGEDADKEGEDADEETNSTTPEDPDPLDDSAEEKKPSRYLFIRVEYDEKFLGPEPVKPEEPQQPEPIDPNAPLVAPRPNDESNDPAASYEILKKKYEDDLKTYEQDLKQREERAEVGKKLAKQLNDRLGAWYYVVASENVESLRVSRESLVQPAGTDAKEKEATETEPPPGASGLPQLPEGLNLPQ